MARIPKISIQGWTTQGPAYTIHRTLAGWRNRRARRELGANANELVGPHPELGDPEYALPDDAGAVFMVFALGEIEVWAFRAGFVYEVTLLVDGDQINVLVDAREGDSIQEYGADLSMLAWRQLADDELESALENGPSIPSAISDGAESQEPKGDHLHEALVESSGNADQPIVALTGAQVEDIAQTAEALEAALTPGTPEHEQVKEHIAEIATTIADVPLTDATVVEHDGVVHGAPAEESPIGETLADEAEPAGSADGRWEELEAKFAADQITDEELDELQALQDAARAAAEGSIGDDEDAVGGADDPASDEEE